MKMWAVKKNTPFSQKVLAVLHCDKRPSGNVFEVVTTKTLPGQQFVGVYVGPEGPLDLYEPAHEVPLSGELELFSE